MQYFLSFMNNRCVKLMLVLLFCCFGMACQGQQRSEKGSMYQEDEFFNLEIDGVIWEADNWNSYAILNDDGTSYSITLEAERSAMDMDPDNQGWLIRFYLQVPNAKLRQLKGNYPITPQHQTAQAYLQLGESETLAITGQLSLEDAHVLYEGNGVAFDLIAGNFLLKTNKGRSLKGQFLIR